MHVVGTDRRGTNHTIAHNTNYSTHTTNTTYTTNTSTNASVIASAVRVKELAGEGVTGQVQARQARQGPHAVWDAACETAKVVRQTLDLKTKIKIGIVIGFHRT